MTLLAASDCTNRTKIPRATATEALDRIVTAEGASWACLPRG